MDPMGNRRIAWALLVACAAWGFGPTPSAKADGGWRVAAAGGFEFWHAPTFGGNGWALVDAQRTGLAAGGRLHLLYNTDTVVVGFEGMRFANGKIELSIVGKGEALLSGLLFAYRQQGERNSGRSFYGSYAQLMPSMKWHFAPRHSLELVTGVRQWFFGRMSSTDDTFVLPPNTFVFEPRLGYTYWDVKAGSEEWEAHRFYPRITGITVGVQLGLDVRSDRRAWGYDTGGGQTDPRNRPGMPVMMARQWMYAGVALGQWGRLQLEEHASWGHGEDDLTRNRAGGMNPYVIPLAGLPWATFLSERLVAGQASLHVKLGASAHEAGVAVNGGAFNDPYRTGQLMSFGGAGGAEAFVDLRFGGWQLYGRFGMAFPSPWQLAQPLYSGVVTAGVRLR